MHITISLARIVTNELVAGWCITERVKILAGNEIELGIGYRRSNIGQVTIRWQREQRMLLCGLTDKDLRRICRSQYGHPGPAIGYWPETSLGHVYIVLEPVGSARLKFCDDRYYEFMWFDVPKVVRSPRWDHGHDEESRNGRDINIDILEGATSWALHWFSLEEERVMQQSSVSISLSFENQGINPVGGHTQVPCTYTNK